MKSQPNSPYSHIPPCYSRERGEVEREYARALRKLVTRHQANQPRPKDSKKEKLVETTQVRPLGNGLDKREQKEEDKSDC